MGLGVGGKAYFSIYGIFIMKSEKILLSKTPKSISTFHIDVLSVNRYQIPSVNLDLLEDVIFYAGQHL